MVRRASVLTFSFTLALAAARSFAPFHPSINEAVIAKASPSSPDLPAAALPGFTGGCTAFSGELTPSSRPYDENQGKATGVLKAFFGQDAAPPGVEYAIALAPDPRHTNLSLMFDREISIVQQAAQDEGYEYNSSWMPWKSDEPKPLSSLGDRQFAADLSDGREACPGVILFRKSPTAPVSSGGSLPRTATQSYAQALVVFVVGEQATGGLNESQWKNAVAWLSQYASPQGNNPAKTGDGILRILGPTFTGSLVSLERDLSMIYAPGPTPLATRFPSARVFSGSVTGCPTVQWFQRQLQADANGNTLYFGTFQENDSLHIFRFLEYLRSQQTEAKDVAILSEDETAYSAAPVLASNTAKLPVPSADMPPPPSNLQLPPPADRCNFKYAQDDRPVHLVYPRDISAIREAYQKESVFQSSDSGLKGGVAHPILQAVVGSESGKDDITDTVPTFSGNNSALGQEAYLYGLVSFFRAHHTRYLVLRCTNPLDFLFLTRFFHRAYPEARIVTIGSDLLFRREIDTTEFRGVLSLTSYPLLPLDQHWSRITQDVWEDKPHDHLVFEGHLPEGMYIATRYLLQDESLTSGADRKPGQPLVLPRMMPTQDYADPFWFLKPTDTLPERSHPPTWMIVIGRDGYWPLAVLRGLDDDKRLDHDVGWQAPNNGSDPVQHGPPSTMVELKNDPAQHYQLKAGGKAYDKSLLVSFPLSWTVCIILSVALVFYQLWGLIRERSYASDGIFSVFHQAAEPSQIFLLGINCALSVLPLIELILVRFIPPNFVYISSWDTRMVGWIAFAAILVVIMLAGLQHRWVEDHNRRLLSGASFILSLTIFVLLNYFAFQLELNPENGLPLFYRMAHLTDGVSPLLPVLLLTLGVYLWSWQALAGNLIMAKGSPTLPEAQTGTAKRYRVDMSATRVSQVLGERIVEIARPLTLTPRITIVPLFLIAAAAVCFRLDNLPLLSLEGHSFNLVFNVALLIAFAITGAEAARLYTTWLFLRKLLQALGRLRLRRTLAQLRPIAANSIWSVSGNVRRFQYALFTQQLDAANRLIRYDTPRPSLHLAIRYGEAFAAQSEAGIDNGNAWDVDVFCEGVKQGRDMREVLSRAVAETYEFLVARWKMENDSLNVECSTPKTDAAKAPENKGDAPGKPTIIPLSSSAEVQAAEEFVCFHYIAFIQNIVARMRTMTLSMIFLFVTICFAISFYPYVPRTEITVWMMLNLILIGAAVAYVYAGLERDEILSFIASTRPGQLGSEFWLKLSGFLAAPVIGVLTTQFPAITDSLLHWLQPGLDAMK